MTLLTNSGNFCFHFMIRLEVKDFSVPYRIIIPQFSENNVCYFLRARVNNIHCWVTGDPLCMHQYNQLGFSVSFMTSRSAFYEA